jgi:hypothetical protein
MRAHCQHLVRRWRLLLSVWVLGVACIATPARAHADSYATPVVWVASLRSVAPPASPPSARSRARASQAAQRFVERQRFVEPPAALAARFATLHGPAFDGRTLHRDHCSFLR